MNCILIGTFRDVIRGEIENVVFSYYVVTTLKVNPCTSLADYPSR